MESHSQLTFLGFGSFEGIDHGDATALEVDHISRRHREPIIPRRCGDHGILDSHGEAGPTNFIHQVAPNDRNVEAPIEAMHAASQSVELCLQIRSSLSFGKMADALPHFSHHHGIGHAFQDVILEPVHRPIHRFGFGWLAEQIRIHQKLHSKVSGLRSFVVSSPAGRLNQSFSGQDFSHSTKSAFEPGSGLASSVSATRTRCPSEKWLKSPARMPALSSPTRIVVLIVLTTLTIVIRAAFDNPPTTSLNP